MVRVEGLTKNQPDINFILLCVVFLVSICEIASDLSVLCSYGKKKEFRPLSGLSTSIKQDVYIEALNETCTICMISKFCTRAMRSRLESQHRTISKMAHYGKRGKRQKKSLKI